jgi:hypothetical protein
MSIEIKQLVIKTRIEDTSASEIDIESIKDSIKKEIVRECKKLIQDMGSRNR